MGFIRYLDRNFWKIFLAGTVAAISVPFGYVLTNYFSNGNKEETSLGRQYDSKFEELRLKRDLFYEFRKDGSLEHRLVQEDKKKDGF